MSTFRPIVDFGDCLCYYSAMIEKFAAIKNSLFKNRTIAEPTPTESSHPVSVETLPEIQGPRVEVFGSRSTGAPIVKKAFEEYVRQHGIKNPQINWSVNVQNIRHSFFNTRSTDTDPKPQIPQGVILFPEMRQYTEDWIGMSVDTFNDYGHKSVFDTIKQLCDEYGVPLVILQANSTNEELSQNILTLLSNPIES
jgi:hypothetical protein